MNYDFGTVKRSLIDEESGVFAKTGRKIPKKIKKEITLSTYFEKDVGEITVIADCSRAKDSDVIDVLSAELGRILQTCESTSCVLCCGIGNPYMVSDSLGYETVRKLMGKGNRRLKLCVPFLEGLTGICSRNLISSVAKDLGADTVLIVDSLATKNLSRVGFSYQFSNGGLIPGSAIGAKKMVDSNFLGVNTVAIGVPTVVRLDQCDELFAPKEIDALIDRASENLSQIIISNLT